LGAVVPGRVLPGALEQDYGAGGGDGTRTAPTQPEGSCTLLLDACGHADLVLGPGGCRGAGCSNAEIPGVCPGRENIYGPRADVGIPLKDATGGYRGSTGTATPRGDFGLM